VIPSKTEGWDLFFTNQMQIGSIHISSYGEFSDPYYMPMPFEQKLIASFGVPVRNEVWFVAEKSTDILRSITSG